MKFLKAFFVVIIISIFEKGLLYFDNHVSYFAHYAHDTALALIVYGLIIFFILVFYRIRKRNWLGIESDDEMSKVRKYKIGYYAYVNNLFLWLFLFTDRIKFHDISNLVGGGIIFSLLIGLFSILLVKKGLYEKQN